MEYKDYYKIMGLDRHASQEEIRRSYRKLARKYHPDVSKEQGAEDKFKELGEAYEILKDPTKRAQYDRYGQYWKAQTAGSSHAGRGADPGARRGAFHAEDMTGFEDFINSIFRQRGQAERNVYSEQGGGEDIHAKLNINLADSFYGAEKILQLQIPVRDHYGGVQYVTRAVKVKIPKGVENKQQIRLRGQGGKAMGNVAGDLYIEMNFNHHPLFHIHKKDIHLELPISPWEAALGMVVKVPTLGGAVNLRIPKLSQAGKKMRLKGKGLPGPVPGDQYVTLKIVIPEIENEKVNQLYQQLSDTIKFNPRKNLGVDYE